MLLKERLEGKDISLRLRDHTSSRSSREEVIWHPYGGTVEDFKELIRLCKRYGLTFFMLVGFQSTSLGTRSKQRAKELRRHLVLITASNSEGYREGYRAGDRATYLI